MSTLDFFVLSNSKVTQGKTPQSATLKKTFKIVTFKVNFIKMHEEQLGNWVNGKLTEEAAQGTPVALQKELTPWRAQCPHRAVSSILPAEALSASSCWQGLPKPVQDFLVPCSPL